MTRMPPFMSPRLIGFDSLNDLVENLSAQSNKTFPPYNILQIDADTYRIELAAAGFGEESLSITREGDKLTITGSAPEARDEVHIIHRGIAMRGFTRQFHLAPHIIVKGAQFVNGLLTIELARETPEAMRPQVVPISTSLVAQAEAPTPGEDAGDRPDRGDQAA